MFPARPADRRRFAAALVVAAVAASWIGPASASRPVPRTITGCVVAGVFISQDGYRIRVWCAERRELVDLSRYEGMEIRYFGKLLPGDNYRVTSDPAVIGPCRKVPTR